MRAPLIAVVLLVGCVPDFVDDSTRVTAPRIVAVQATPAEAKEGEEVTLDALVVAPVASVTSALEWSLCVDRKPLSELGPVSTRCLASPTPGAAIALVVPPEPPVVATLPETACQLFGPDRPDPKPGEPSGRPVDADVTGGFYQPVLAWLASEPVLGAVRLSCPLTGASVANTREFNARYHPNQNPAPAALESIGTSGVAEVLSEPSEHVVHPGERVSLRITWPDCPPDAEGCGGTESYVVYDALTQALVARSESFVVSWYATGGTFAEPRTEEAAHAPDELPGARNTWTAPGAAGPAIIWAVVRDDRGGQAWIFGLRDPLTLTEERRMLTRKTTYGIRALVNIARAGERSLSVAEIAEREGIPPKFLAGILSDLRQRGIVRGQRGPIGGYQLAVAPEALSIAEVVETLGGPLFPFVCLARAPHDERCRECPGADTCPARHALSGACAAAYRALGSLALSDILEQLPVAAPANEAAPAPEVGPGTAGRGG